MIAPLVFRHASQCLTLKHTKSISLADLLSSSIYIWPIHIFLPNHLEKHPFWHALFLDGSCSSPAFRVASSAPEAGRRCMRRLRTARPPWSSCWSLRGPRWTRPTDAAVALEGFSGRFGSGSDEVMEGVRTLAGDFRFALVRANNMIGNQKQACCRRMFNGLKCLVIWILIPV